MLTATPASSPQTTQAPSRSEPAREAPRQEPNSPAAQRFREALQQAKGGKPDLPQTLRKGAKQEQPDGLATAVPPPVAPPLQQSQERGAPLKRDEKAALDASGAGHSDALAPVHTAEGAEAAARTMDPATMDMAAKFAERLALTPHTAGDTQLMLDPARFSVTQVTISGSAEDMSFAYESGAGDREGSPDEEALRQRLEARGIKVGSVERKA